MSEMLKIVRASAIGSGICTAFALLFSPSYWWLGLVAGFASGYLAYEFRAALQAIPHAFSAASGKIGNTAAVALGRIVRFFSTARPIAHPPVFVGALLSAFTIVYILTSMPFKPGTSFIVEVIIWTATVFMLVCVGMAFTVLLTCCYTLLAWAGARYLCDVWFLLPGDGTDGGFRNQKALAKLRERKDLREMKTTYLRIAFWAVLGIPGSLIATIVAFMFVLYYLGITLYFLVRIIHSNQRVLCGVDGALGGYLSYQLFTRPQMTAVQYLAAIVAGAILGAAIGAASWRYLSQRATTVAVA